MTVRLARVPATDDDGITVEAAARIVGGDETTVRELVRIGELEGWRVGKQRKGKPPTAIRVSRGSCYDYRDRHAIAEPGAREVAKAPKPRSRPRRPSAAHLEAIAELRARGFRV